jgi:hypothetical protein
MTATDQNVQDISVHDKEVSALPPTVEGQDMSTLSRVVVPVPSFTDPHNPKASAGSINLDLDSHPFEHSEDYGAVEREAGAQTVRSPMDVGEESKADATKLGGGDGEGNPGKVERDKSTPQIDLPENRDEWTKAHYQAALRKVGLPVSGNLEALTTRFDEYEAQEEEYEDYNAGDWISDIEDAETVDDLVELQSAYERSGAEFKTVAEAFEKKSADLNKQS